MTKQFVISANTKGAVADGYALGDVTISGSNLLKISGPASVVEQVNAAVAVINVDGISTSISDSVIPILYDEEGNAVDTTKLDMNISSVSISAIVMGTKKVPVTFKTSGIVAENYAIVSVTPDEDTLRIKGNASALNGVASIDLPESLIDVTGVTETFKTTVDIADYLPEGITAVDAADTVFTVVVEVDRYETRSFKLPTSNISVTGVNAGYEVSFADKEVEVLVGGTAKALDELTSEGLALSLNVEALTEGEHSVALQMTREDDRYRLTEANVKVNINKSAEVSAGVDNAGNANGPETVETVETVGPGAEDNTANNTNQN